MVLYCHSRKKETWATLAKEFNAGADGVYRAEAVLKRKWENIKKREKESYANSLLTQTHKETVNTSRLTSCMQKYIKIIESDTENM